MLIVLSCCGCSGLLFYPNERHVLKPVSLGLHYRDVYLKTPDGLTIHGWFLPAQGELKGSVYFLHGNAQNISMHIHNVKWLPEQGYQVLLIDYRGFGHSEGKPNLPGIFLDIETGFDWLIAQSESKPLFLLGQSLGASLGIYFAARNPSARQHLDGIVSDAAFTGYFQIAREAAANHWLTWPFQYLFAWSLNYPYNPIEVVEHLTPIPLLFFHSADDRIIPFDHGRQLYRTAKPPKRFHPTQGGHIQTFRFRQNREVLLDFFATISAKNQSIIPIALQISALTHVGAGVFGRFCSSAIAELHGCNECRKCRSIFLPCIALIHAIHG
ncbi:MAG: alpha/beta hydrolase, partial [Gammaproteobacteria bacterium HGW-Gammaproteobacteria-10]